MVPARLAVVACALLALPGCKERWAACAPARAAQLEVRGPDGALELALKPGEAPNLSELCDPSHKRVGTLLSEPALVTLLDAAGGLILRLKVESKDDASGDGPKGPRLRLHRDAQEARVLNYEGVPFGSISPKPEGGAAVLSPASQTIAIVEKREKDVVVADMKGATRTYVVPSKSPVAAGVFALDGLTLPEKLAIYLVWSR